MPGILGRMLRQAAAPVGLILVGVVVLLLTHSSTAGIAAATMLIGTACVIAVSLVFLAVGRSEDAERAAAAARRRPLIRTRARPRVARAPALRAVRSSRSTSRASTRLMS